MKTIIISSVNSKAETPCKPSNVRCLRMDTGRTKYSCIFKFSKQKQLSRMNQSIIYLFTYLPTYSLIHLFIHSLKIKEEGAFFSV